MLGELYSHMQKNKLDPYFTPYINQKWINDLNRRIKTVKKKKRISIFSSK